jgi:triphosphoribosyl-dephospho-CoA synthase
VSAVLELRRARVRAVELGGLARACLHLELETWPKPGLVSPVDRGAHGDMDIALMRRSADALEPWFAALADAGAAGADMTRLRRLGIAAEAAMLAATGGVNAHRGAIFGLGLLVAAAAASGPGREAVSDETLGARVARRWGPAILARPASRSSHGGRAGRRYGAGGARLQAASGFPALYRTALPGLAEGERLAGGAPAPARVHALFRLIAVLDDTNLLHRGGAAGLAFAQAEAKAFLAAGGVARPDWLERAQGVHRRFVARNLSPGAAADLLAMALFVRTVEGV